MIRQFILTLIIALISLASLKGQNALLATERFPELRYQYLKGAVEYNNYMQIKGQAFLTSDWTLGTIYLKNGYVVHDVKLKLDRYAHRLIVYQENLKRVLDVDKYLIDEFTCSIDGQEKRFRLIDDLGTKARAENGSFLEVLQAGEISFFRLYYCDVIPLQEREGVFLDEFVPESVFYLYDKGSFSRIRLSRRVILKLYPEHTQALKQYMRKEHIHPKIEEDFAKAVGYLNSLLTSGNQ